MKKSPETIVQKHAKNFEVLRKAFESGDVCLMDCIEKKTGEHVAVICAVNRVKNERGKPEIETIPFAKFFNGNPFEMLIPPLEEGYK